MLISQKFASFLVLITYQHDYISEVADIDLEILKIIVRKILISDKLFVMNHKSCDLELLWLTKIKMQQLLWIKSGPLKPYLLFVNYHILWHNKNLYRDDDGFVFIVERLISRCRIDDR